MRTTLTVLANFASTWSGISGYNCIVVSRGAMPRYYCDYCDNYLTHDSVCVLTEMKWVCLSWCFLFSSIVCIQVWSEMIITLWSSSVRIGADWAQASDNLSAWSSMLITLVVGTQANSISLNFFRPFVSVVLHGGFLSPLRYEPWSNSLAQ